MKKTTMATGGDGKQRPPAEQKTATLPKKKK
jgi:hypothetical protein